MCLRPLSLSLSTRGAPYLVYSVIKGRFLLIHGFNKTRSIGSSAPHSTIIFFPTLKIRAQLPKIQNQKIKIASFVSYLDYQATSWTRSRREKLIIICRDFAPWRAEAKQEDDDFITKKKSITQKFTSYHKSEKPFFALCLHFANEREELEANRKLAATERYVFFLSIASYQFGGEKRRVQFYRFQFYADSDQLWIMRQ